MVKDEQILQEKNLKITYLKMRKFKRKIREIS